ncbi:YybH family protein [Shewanella youngdeokensis]|uniref:Nuclear transport factor 2 family protein n=1 Tax=Shewanella youngdeokensis TaxID=2999068 RepID=A0ABZ0K1S0_9GAMM|nr:nuclear transport factor 2 family protein [Shewanella sp. DAU334]
MKKIFFASLAAVLMQLAVVPAANADTNDDLNNLLVQYADSVNRLDLEMAKSIWSQTESISFIHPRGHQFGWAEIKKAFYLGAMGYFTERDLRLRDININQLSEDTAWADFYWDFDATTKTGEVVHHTGRESQVWKKEDSGWKIVHVHYSRPPK